jgi:hypothetical protein
MLMAIQLAALAFSGATNSKTSKLIRAFLMGIQ